MKTLAVLFCGELTHHSFIPLSDGRVAFERALSAMLGLPGVERCLILSSERRHNGYPSPDRAQLESVAARLDPDMGKVRLVSRERWDVSALFTALVAESEGYDNVAFSFGDQPHVDPSFSRSLHERHERYAAEYTFADGYPVGIAPEYLARGILPVLERLSAESRDPVTRSTLFDTIKKDINSFDIETDIAPVDLRHLRLTLACDTRQGLELSTALDGITADTYAEIVRDRAASLRVSPNFYAVQVAARCPFECVYCPYPAYCAASSPKGTGRKPTELDSLSDPLAFASLMERVARFSETAVVSLSLWGECSYHDRLPELFSSVLSHPGLSILLETTGIGWSDETLATLAGIVRDAGPRMDGKRPIDWIVSIDATSPSRYAALRGLGGDKESEGEALFREATSFVGRLASLFPESVWPQTVRMNDNEEELEGFYRHWKDEVGRVIVQKHDHFCKSIEDRRVADLSPLDRHPCWHIKRDMSILIDGTVPLCREDLYAARSFGNAYNDDLSSIWARFQPVYEQHLESDFKGMCGACDEFYTCNF